MEKTLRELVSDLPTESLELYVQHYEAGEVGYWDSTGCTRTQIRNPPGGRRCPRASLGFSTCELNAASVMPTGHPAQKIERRAQVGRLDTAELYSEAVLAITERDATLTPEREAVEV